MSRLGTAWPAGRRFCRAQSGHSLSYQEETQLCPIWIHKLLLAPRAGRQLLSGQTLFHLFWLVLTGQRFQGIMELGFIT